MSNFYMILTSIGIAKIANSQITQNTIDLTQMAVGDSNGTYYTPTQAATALVNEKWRGAISAVTTDENNPNWIVVDSIIPSSVGGFTIREVGLFDSQGDMIAIGKVPETYKPAFEEGSSKDLYLKTILEVSNASVVTIKADPAVIIASRKYVDDKVAGAIGNIGTDLTELDQRVTTHLDEKSGKHVTIDNTVTATKPSSEFAVGLTYSRPIPNTGSATYTSWRDLILNKVGMPLSGVHFVLGIETFKRSTTGLVEQTIKAYDNVNNAAQYGKVLLTATRTGDSNGWHELYIQTAEYIGSGSPEGILRALHGATYFDYTNNKTYTRKPTTLGVGTNGWVEEFSGSYNDLKHKPTIPDVTSEQVNLITPRLPSQLTEDYPKGYSAFYTSDAEWINEVGGFLGVTFTSLAIRLYVETIRGNTTRGGIQRVTVISNYSDTHGAILHILTRGQSALSSSGWTAWQRIIRRNNSVNWLSVTGQNGFLNSEGRYYKNELGEVHLSIIRGTNSSPISSGTVLFTLPAGYRPDTQLSFPAVILNATGYISVLPSGEVKYESLNPQNQTVLTSYFVYKAVE